MAVAMSLKELKKDCPLCRLVVSYADCDKNHLGTIYQATNWIYTGEVTGQRYFVIKGKKTHQKTIYSHKVNIDGKRIKCPQTLEAVRRFFDKDAQEVHSLGKRKYLMPLDKKIRKQIEPLRQPYPKKDEDWHKIDRTTFKNELNKQPTTTKLPT